MAGIGSSTNERLEEGASRSSSDRLAAHRARLERQREITARTQNALDFELGEDKPQNAEGRAEQDAKWAAAKVDARGHFSIRELLKVQKPAIVNALDDFHRVETLISGIGRPSDEAAMLTRLTPELLELVVGHAMPGQGPLVPALLSSALNHRPPAHLGTFRIYVRVRPLLPAEIEAGEYTAITSDRPTLVCHDGRLARSGRRLSMIHHWYHTDKVHGASSDEAAVCDDIVEPLLSRVVSGAGDATALLYGQTGAGKTYTLASFLERVAARLDELAVAPVDVTFFEIASKGCTDLLNGRSKIDLRSDENDVTHACGAVSATVTSGAELRETLERGLAMRSTVETQANPISSRSHAICVLKFGGGGTAGGGAAGRGAATSATGATLRLVDLAGSERNYETHYEKTREFQRESAAINKSLMALKDCFREAARAREQRHKRACKAAAAAAAAASGGGGAGSAAAGGKDGSGSAGGAAAGYIRMRRSQEEADGQSQHIDLTPMAHRAKQWKSSWRKGMVNGKPVGADACPAIEISDTNTGELLYSGDVVASEERDAEVHHPPASTQLQRPEPPAVQPQPQPQQVVPVWLRQGDALEAANLAAALQRSAVENRDAAAEKAAAGKKAADKGRKAAEGDVPSVAAAKEGEEPVTPAAPADNAVAADAAPVEAPAAAGAGAAAAAAPAAGPPKVRVPYRGSTLTRVLRNCFEDDNHRTAIVAAVAPGAESVIHTLNTLDHVVLMAPHLRHASCEVDVPMVGADTGKTHSYEETPVHEWSAAQVVEWLANSNNGRFAQVAIAKGTEGKDLLRMTASRLTELVETENVDGRQDGEGWYVSTQARVGRALFAALRDAQRSGPMRGNVMSALESYQGRRP